MSIFFTHLILAKKSLVEVKKKLILAVISTILVNFFVYPAAGLADIDSVGQKTVVGEERKNSEDKPENKENWSLSLVADNELSSLFKVINPQVLAKKSGFIDRNRLPKSETAEVKYTLNNIVFTAYNSEVGQCDDSPCVTANGFNVCKHGKEDTIAANGLKFGTKIRIPEIFGDRVFVVRDRMNSKYGSERMDIWMVDKKEAKKFGVKIAKIEVLE